MPFRVMLVAWARGQQASAHAHTHTGHKYTPGPNASLVVNRSPFGQGRRFPGHSGSGQQGSGDHRRRRQCMQVVPVGFDTDPCPTTRQAVFHRNHGVVSNVSTTRFGRGTPGSGLLFFTARRGEGRRAGDRQAWYLQTATSDQTKPSCLSASAVRSVHAPPNPPKHGDRQAGNRLIRGAEMKPVRRG